MNKNIAYPWGFHGLYLQFKVLGFSCSMCQSSSNVMAITAVAFFSGMNQQEDAAPHMGHTMTVIVVVGSMLLPSGNVHCG